MPVLKMLLSSAAMGVAVFAARAALGRCGLNPFASLAVLIALGGAVYLGAVSALMPGAVRALVFAKRKFKRS